MPVTINGNGSIQGLNTPVFRAVYNGVSFTVNNNTLTPIVYNTVQSASGTYNTFTGRWTPPVAGWYSVSYTVLGNYDTATGWLLTIASLIKNGLEYHRTGQGVGREPVFNVSATTLVYMNGTTDYLQVGVRLTTNNGGVNAIVNGGPEGPIFNSFSAYLVKRD